MTIAADEINFLLRQYLREVGLHHTSYVFGNECVLDRVGIDVSLPPHALVTILKKGLMYVQMEKGIAERAKSITSHESIIDSMMEAVRNNDPIIPAPITGQAHTDSIAAQRPVRNKRMDVPPRPPVRAKPAARSPAMQTAHLQIDSDTVMARQPVQAPIQMPTPAPRLKSDSMTMQGQFHVPVGTNKLTIPIMSQKQDVLELSSHMVLKNHTANVFCCSWTRDGRYLATGGGDGRATIWEFRDSECVNCYTLDHTAGNDREGRGVNAVVWDCTGTILATGCDDGSTRLWSNTGMLKSLMSFHTDAVFVTKFSPSGTLLVTGSADRKIAVWNVATGELQRYFQFHASRILDFAWLCDYCFASCSGDWKIAIFQVNDVRPIYVFDAHFGEVNEIAWDKTGQMLASCSDDKTVRVCRPFDPKKPMPVIFTGHSHHVYTIRWSPGPRPVIASGALDYTVRLWDVMDRTCLLVMQEHRHPVYTINFSPCGSFLLSGGSDRKMHIWRTNNAVRVASYDAGSGILYSEWDPTGNMISLCLADSNVVIIDGSIFGVKINK